MITIKEIEIKYPSLDVNALTDSTWNNLDEAMFNEDWQAIKEILAFLS